MKKSLFFIPAALLAFASCSNEDFDGTTGNGYQGETETRYLSVNIVDNYSGGTRADNTTGYEDGTEAENEVTYVRFYLFGEPGGDFENTSVDCTAEAIEETSAPNVEKMLHSVIVFEAPLGDPEPIQIVAVVNPPAGTLALAEKYDSPEDLQTDIAIANYNIATKGNFILSNSVFVNNDGKEQVGYEIPEDKIFTTRNEALLAPVEIYVERVVAKARVEVKDMKKTGDYYNILSKKTDDGNTTITVDIYDPETEKLEETEIYLNLLGWNVTGTAKETRLIKKVEDSWTSITGLTAWNWNHPANNRSYWAENIPGLKDLGEDNYKDRLNFGTFNGTDATAASAIKGFSANDKNPNYTYLLENAAADESGVSSGYATKLIVAAQLVDKDGKGVDLAWWKGNYYMKEDLLDVLATESRVYSLIDGKYTPITKADLTYKTATEVNGDTYEGKRYFSYARLNRTLTGDNWYTKDGTGKYNKIEGDPTASVNKILKDLDVVKVWTNGSTYYWTDITHLGAKPADDAANYGYTGIVRNHIYDYELTGFIGLGIPVLNPGDPTTPGDTPPGDTIYPEDPDDPEYAFIAARINVLSWRFIGHKGTQLGWE